MPHLAPLHWLFTPLFILVLMYVQMILFHSFRPISFPKTPMSPLAPPNNLNWK